MEQFLVVEAIRDRFRPMLKDTRLCPNTVDVRSLRSRDVVPSHPAVLGVGTFSQVTRVVLRGSDVMKNNKRYACKQLKQELFSKPRDFVKAAAELAYEAFILSCFDHPNIIKLRGLAKDGIASFGNGANDTKSCVGTLPATSFFLIMDVLQETLDQRIERWNTFTRPQSLIETHQRTIEKFSLCQQLASVLEYIHSKGVVYRDLKPQNIGFCKQERGILKLFDFGLSRELPQSIAGAASTTTAARGTGETANPNQHERFKLSGMVGTIRYMAPEVCLSQPYNRDCDIFSWSIVAWEIWSQTKPFDTFTPDLYTALVCKHGFRPTNDDAVNAIIPLDVEALLKEAWKSEPDLRMRFSGIQCRLSVLENFENLRLQELIQEEAAASLADMTFIDDPTNISLFRFPMVQRLRGVTDMDAPIDSPFMNMNQIGSTICANAPSIVAINKLGFGKYPRRTVGSIHRHNSSGMQVLSPPSGPPPSNLDPVMWADAFDPHTLGNL
jgi:serine/threonine protein kinase